jgi:hypothetical protein
VERKAVMDIGYRILDNGKWITGKEYR